MLSRALWSPPRYFSPVLWMSVSPPFNALTGPLHSARLIWDFRSSICCILGENVSSTIFTDLELAINYFPSHTRTAAAVFLRVGPSDFFVSQSKHPGEFFYLNPWTSFEIFWSPSSLSPPPPLSSVFVAGLPLTFPFHFLPPHFLRTLLWCLCVS